MQDRSGSKARRSQKRAELAKSIRSGVDTYRAKALVQLSFWTCAVIVGIFAVYFGKMIETLQERYGSWFAVHPWLASAVTPFAFLGATAVVKFFAPHAGGSGVPQTLYVASLSNEGATEAVQEGLISIRTSIVKVLSTAIGFIGGASVGGEGPTVQISTSIFQVSR